MWQMQETKVQSRPWCRTKSSFYCPLYLTWIYWCENHAVLMWSPAAFKIPQIPSSDSVWRVPVCACQWSVWVWLRVILTNSLMTVHLFSGEKTHTSTNLYQSLFFLILAYTWYFIHLESCGLNQKKEFFFSIVVLTTRVSLFFSFLVWLGIISLNCPLAMLQPGISHKENGMRDCLD